MKKFTIILILLMLQCVSAFAKTPNIILEFDDEAPFYNPEIITKFINSLSQKLTVDGKFIIEENEQADYKLQCEILGMGRGKVINNIIASSFAIGGSGASMFVTPLIGPVIQAAGVTITNKKIFGIAVRINFVYLKDNKILYERTFLGRTALKKSDKLSVDILDLAIDSTADLISQKILKCK